MVLKIIEEGQTLKDAAASFSVCPKTMRKWLARYREEGVAGLQDRSSRPHKSPRRTPEEKQAQALACRREGLVYAEVASRTGLSEATLSRLLRRVPRHPPPAGVSRCPLRTGRTRGVVTPGHQAAGPHRRGGPPDHR
jgi:transposase